MGREEIELSNFNIERCTELSLINDLSFANEIFLSIVEKIIDCMKKLKIDINGKCLYYQRYPNKTSVLAIKLNDEVDTDYTNYMLNGCDANYFDSSVMCDVYLHADAKVARSASNVANMISKDIVDFFNTIEGELVLHDLMDTEIMVKIPLVQYVNNNNNTRE